MSHFEAGGGTQAAPSQPADGIRGDSPNPPPAAVQAAALGSLLTRPEPLLALAPMQDVTDLPFWWLLSRYGGPDVYWTEYFRVHGTSSPEKWILESILRNPTGRPAIAQMIGNDIPALVRTARELQKLPVAAIDLNLGCPAPVVYRKCAGGGLLREPARIDAILGALRDAIGANGVRFTVKTRVGFDHPGTFDTLLPIFARHSIDLLTVHGRTVAEMYRSEVRYELIAQAARSLRCPVLANGNVWSAQRARQVLEITQARGLMIGRGCIRNPWIFQQTRDLFAGRPARFPTGRDVLAYVEALWSVTEPPGSKERLQVEKMKKYMNFIGAGIGPDAAGSSEFLHHIRRCTTRTDFFIICQQHLDHDRPLQLEPLVPENKSAGEVP